MLIFAAMGDAKEFCEMTGQLLVSYKKKTIFLSTENFVVMFLFLLL